MATIEDMRNILSQLRAGSSIPGLDASSVVDNYVEVEFKDTLDEIKDPEERKKMKNRFVEHYITGPGKQFIDDNIERIKFLYKQVTDSFSALQSSAAQVTALNVVPAVLTVGSATSSPNPAYYVIDNAQKKQALLAIIKSVTDFLQQLFAYAILINFVLPDSVQQLVSLLATVTSIINAIPG